MLAFGPLVDAYGSFDVGAGGWGDPLEFASGYVFLVVGDAEQFRLVVLSDDRELLRTDEVETYCGWAVVTEIVAKLITQEHSCDEGGTSIKFTLNWTFTVGRMRADTGDLERVVRGSLYTEAWMPNVWHDPALLYPIDYAVDSSVRAYLAGSVRAAVPGPMERAYYTGAPELIINHSGSGCAGTGVSVVTVLNEHLRRMWSSEEVAAVDASGDHVGPEAVTVAHALYLLKSSPAFDGCVGWIESVCNHAPFECKDEGPPLDPWDDEVPEVIAGP